MAAGISLLCNSRYSSPNPPASARRRSQAFAAGPLLATDRLLECVFFNVGSHVTRSSTLERISSTSSSVSSSGSLNSYFARSKLAAARAWQTPFLGHKIWRYSITQICWFFNRNERIFLHSWRIALDFLKVLCYTVKAQWQKSRFWKSRGDYRGS